MRIGFLITARLKSSRLKQKLLLPLNGYTVIERVVQRAKAVVECDDIVLCTSYNQQDLPLARIALKNDIFYFNGQPEDVLQRLLDACHLFNFDYFIGITADNPLFSIYHANLLSDEIRQNPDIDYIYTSGLPLGANIYVLKVKALETICEVKNWVNTEIWGYYIKQKEIFRLKEIEAFNIYRRKKYRLTLDEIEDYQLLRLLYNNFQKDEVIDLLSAYDFLDKSSEIAKINSKVVQRDLAEKRKREIDDFFKKNVENILKIKERIYSS